MNTIIKNLGSETLPLQLGLGGRGAMFAPCSDNSDRAFNKPIHEQCDRVSLLDFSWGRNAIAFGNFGREY